MTRFPHFARRVAIILCLSGAAVAQDQPEGGASARDLGSSWVDIRSGGVVGREGGAYAIVLFLENKTDQSIWVRVEVRSPDPAQNCAVARQIAARGKQPYACPQKEIVPDRDYPVVVDTFSNEELSEQLESRDTKMHFRAQDVAALKRHLAVPRRPVVLTDVWYRTDESQLLRAYKEAGTLEIAGDGLLFTYSGGKLEIPSSSIQRIIPKKRFVLFDANEWVVIEYRLAGKDLVAAFKPAAFTGKTSHEEILEAVRSALP